MRKSITRIADMYQERINSTLNKISTRLSSMEHLVCSNMDDLFSLLGDLQHERDQNLKSEVESLLDQQVDIGGLLEDLDD